MRLKYALTSNAIDESDLSSKKRDDSVDEDKNADESIHSNRECDQWMKLITVMTVTCRIKT
jgi:hypothetical protein